MSNPEQKFKFDSKAFEQKWKNLVGIQNESEKETAAKKTGAEMIASLDNYEQNLENVRDKISNSEEHLNEEAKKSLRAGDQTRAKRLLKKKKLLAQRRATLNSMMLQIDEMKDSIEACEEVKEYFDIAKESINVIHKLQSQVSAEELSQLEEGFEEMKENKREIADMFQNILNENEQEFDQEYKDLLQEVEKTTRFTLRMACTLPRLEITHQTQAISDDLYKIDLTIRNNGYLPTYLTDSLLDLQLDHAIKVEINGGELISGQKISEIEKLEGFGGIPSSLGFYANITTEAYQPLKQTLSYIVKGKAGDEISFNISSPKTGYQEIKLAL